MKKEIKKENGQLGMNLKNGILLIVKKNQKVSITMGKK